MFHQDSRCNGCCICSESCCGNSRALLGQPKSCVLTQILACKRQNTLTLSQHKVSPFVFKLVTLTNVNKDTLRVDTDFFRLGKFLEHSNFTHHFGYTQTELSFPPHVFLLFDGWNGWDQKMGKRRHENLKIVSFETIPLCPNRFQETLIGNGLTDPNRSLTSQETI